MTQIAQDRVVRPSVLVVDDTPAELALLHSLLADSYQVKVASNGPSALRLLASDSATDLILLDVMMPAMDGHAVCQALKADAATRDIPVVFLTARAQDEERCFAAGAADFITKPIHPGTLLARVRAHLQSKARADLLRERSSFLEAEVARRTKESDLVLEVTILALASLAETRDAQTGNHIRRTQHYVRMLAWKLSSHPRFRHYLTVANIAALYKAAPLHDIGKLGIPDRILLKPGALTPQEFDIMKTHTTLGRDALANAERALGADTSMLALAKEIAYCHQEKWDGSGYPQGLSGDAIPIAARLMAVADVYDALVSRRAYRDSMPHADAVRVIEATRGRHFDPDVVDAFLDLQAQFHAVALGFSDTPWDMEAKEAYRKLALASAP